MEHAEGLEANYVGLGDFKTEHVFNENPSPHPDCYHDSSAVQMNTGEVAGNEVVSSSTYEPVEQGAGGDVAASKNVTMLAAVAESLLQMPSNDDELRDYFINSNQVIVGEAESVTHSGMPDIIVPTQITKEENLGSLKDVESATSSFNGQISLPKNEPASPKTRGQISLLKIEQVSSKPLGQQREKLDDKSINCRLCKQVFHKANILDMHYIEAHDLHMAYQCWRCSYQTNAYISMERHMEVCGTSAPIPCALCLEMYKDITDLNTHVSKAHPHIHSRKCYCVVCGVKFNSHALMLSHVRSIHSEEGSGDERGKSMESDNAKPPAKRRGGTPKDQVLCSECGDAFENISIMLAHKADTHLNKKLGKVSKSVSSQNAEVAAKRPKLRISMKVLLKSRTQHAEPSNDSVPEETDPSESSGAMHSCPYTAEGCTYKTKRKNCLEKHKETHKDRYSCDKCDFKCKKQNMLRTHLSFEHQGPMIPCPHADTGCKYKTQKKYFMTSHLKLRHDDKFSCDLCAFKCHKKNTLRAHYQEIHGDMSYQSFLCPLCGRKFRFNRRLQIHLRIHRNDRPFICEQCGSAFASNSMLKDHVRCKHPSAGDKVICDVCGKEFPVRSYLLKHMKTTHIEREHLCNVCPKAFKTAAHLKAHTRVHTGEKPFKCEECGKTFKQLCGLMAHKNAHEGNKRYVCSSCSTPFLYNSSLKNGLCNQCRKNGKFTPEMKEIAKPSGMFDNNAQKC